MTELLEAVIDIYLVVNSWSSDRRARKAEAATAVAEARLEAMCAEVSANVQPTLDAVGVRQAIGFDALAFSVKQVDK